MKELLTITLGQSPRKDIQEILDKYIGYGTNINQVGLLDDVPHEEYERMTSISSGQDVYVSKLSVGSEVILDKEAVEEKVSETIRHFEAEGVRQILLLCTGEFEDLGSGASSVYTPEKLIFPTIATLVREHQFGIIVPKQEQVHMMWEKWRKYDLSPIISSASPYSDVNCVLKAGRRLKNEGAEYILLDCMGYTEEMKMAVLKETNIPVILSNTLMAKVLSELLV